MREENEILDELQGLDGYAPSLPVPVLWTRLYLDRVSC
jgi:hypothetical protein